jgi:(p)ppGpp synthase/HD superfamily hydrolase
MSSNVIIKAAQIAAKAHEGQFRKYGRIPQPYMVHPIRVAGLVATHLMATEQMVAAAFLHDVLEDTSYTEAHLQKHFDSKIVYLVRSLTNPSKQFKDKPRAERKAMDRAHLRDMPWEVRLIKLADRLDNIADMNGSIDTPKDFDTLYRSETVELYKVLAGTDVDFERRLIAAVQRV